MAVSSSMAHDEEADDETYPPLRLLELPHELLDKAVALLPLREWGSFATVCKTAKAVAEGRAVGDVVDAEVTRMLIANEPIDNSLCSRWPTLEVRVGVTTIGNHAFRGCSSMISVALPVSVITIGHSAFQDCSALNSLTLPESVDTISSEAFLRCASLVSLTLPTSLTIIGHFAFLECSALTSLTLPNGVTTICFGAFAHCTSLTSVTLPESLTTSPHLPLPIAFLLAATPSTQSRGRR